MDEIIDFPSLQNIDMSSLEWHVDPMQNDQLMEKMSQSSAFAECLNKPKTKIFFEFLSYKTRYRENIGIEVKGGTRTGKSTVGQAICKYVAYLTGVPFTLWHTCANEIEYLEKIKIPNIVYGSSFLIDEQTETHAGAGSYTEMQVLEDMSNIIAKQQIHTVWVHPHEFVGRNSQLGLECYGKNFEYLLVRCILYNISVTSLSKTPMGMVIIPVGWLFHCGLFATPTVYNGRQTIITCIKDVCPRYGKCQEFMAQYEYKKDKQIDMIRTREFGEREMNRLDIIQKISEDENFQNCKSMDERIGVARLLVPYGTPEKLIVENSKMAVGILKGRINLESLKAMKSAKTTEGKSKDELEIV